MPQKYGCSTVSPARTRVVIAACSWQFNRGRPGRFAAKEARNLQASRDPCAVGIGENRFWVRPPDF
ncbi:hypothetical protein ZHAS_00008814 [Anopheles sinensis]|uniref:Uncharacterized protein n=1 Tax=Anopheles sinensis TaxID=74873 RepID=A0A084VTN7_ANOSI|nr:hypothetical protein ZHAS_00008814 [Anopheles sinensis]